MICCRDDIAKLWALRDESKAALVAKHDYNTKAHSKYLGNKNEDHPRKNWPSVILWNCGHPAHKLLTPDFIARQRGAFLHRFQWLHDEAVGELLLTWNWLTTEYDENDSASLLHYTVGTPCFKEYTGALMALRWHKVRELTQQGMGV